MKQLFAGFALAFLMMNASAQAATVVYTDFSDFGSTTTTSDTGENIDGSTNFTENGGFGISNGAGLAVSASLDPMTFTGFTAFEVGMIFGNDQPISGESGFFDVTLSVFSGGSLLGSTTVASNGNDLNDQFIGLGSEDGFDRVELSYSSTAGNAARFVTRIDLGYDDVVNVETAVVPLPAGLPLLLAGLGAFAFIRRRQN